MEKDSALLPNQNNFEPSYPKNQKECDEYCHRLANVLKENLKDRLICVLLSGSWAVGEADPTKSDIDLTVVVDKLDTDMMKMIKNCWRETGAGFVNIYDLPQVNIMLHEAFHMYTVNAIVIYGKNPFPRPSKADYVNDFLASSEILARMIRNLTYAYWQTEDEILDDFTYTFGKTCLQRTLRNLIAFRTGIYPQKTLDYISKLKNEPEFDFIQWLDSLSPIDKLKNKDLILNKLGSFINKWFEEIFSFKKELGEN